MPKAPKLVRRLAALHLPRVRPAAAVLPFMLPTLVDEVPAAPGWVFEIKWDGVRVLAVRAGERVELRSRTGRLVTGQYPEVATAVADLAGGDLALDVEVVALDDEGRPTFERLQRRMHVARGVAAAVPVVAYAYDCLVLHGHDLRPLPLTARKALLATLVPTPGVLRYADHVDHDGRAFLEAACARGLEGIVAKLADAPYRGGRRLEWRKVKCQHRQELVIGGWTEPQGTRAHLGALHLGYYEGGDLVYAGRVGSGFDEATLVDLAARLRRLATPRCPFTRGAPPAGPAHHWVRPALVCEVRFTEWTSDGSLRHPVYLGLRADKRAADVRRERPPTPRA